LIPLPWWEGSKGRGSTNKVFTPTLVLPHQGGGNMTMPSGLTGRFSPALVEQLELKKWLKK